jgi:hypothetical protein
MARSWGEWGKSGGEREGTELNGAGTGEGVQPIRPVRDPCDSRGQSAIASHNGAMICEDHIAHRRAECEDKAGVIVT